MSECASGAFPGASLHGDSQHHEFRRCRRHNADKNNDAAIFNIILGHGAAIAADEERIVCGADDPSMREGKLHLVSKRRTSIAKESMRIRHRTVQGNRPEVIVEFLFDKGLLFISVRNIGNKPATQVSVRFEQKLLGLSGTKDVSAQALFRNIAFLGPQREIATLLDRSSSYFATRQPTKLVARVRYNDLEGNRYAETIRHDLEIYRELAYTEAGSGGAGADNIGQA